MSGGAEGDRLRGILSLDDASHERPDEHIPLASVLVLLDERDAPRLFFTVRSSQLEYHAGQISFPGGQQEDGERPFLAALREAQEEVGLPPEAVELLGYMEPLRTRGSNFWVTPTVGLLRESWEVRPNVEVESVFWATLDELRAVRHEEMFDREGRSFPLVSFPVGEHLIWGVTGWIVASFFSLLDGEAGIRF